MVSKQKLHHLIDQLPEADAEQALAFLVSLLGTPQVADESLDDESRVWLEADLGGELPPFEWGPAGPPKGLAVRYVPGEGLMVEGEHPLAP